MLLSEFSKVKKRSNLVEHVLTEADIEFGPETGKESYPASYVDDKGEQSDGRLVLHVVSDLLPRIKDDELTLKLMRDIDAVEQGSANRQNIQSIMAVFKSAKEQGLVKKYQDAIGKYDLDYKDDDNEDMEEGNAYAHAVRKAKMDGAEKGDEIDGPDGKKIKLEDHDMSDEARELVLYAENDYQLYSQSAVPIMKNLTRKHKKGVYDPELAVKLWKYHADRAAKKYGKEHGNDDGFKIFSPADRREAAKYFEEYWTEELEAGNAMEGKVNEAMDRDDAKSELLEILHQLEDLSREAKGIAQEYFPNSYRQGDAYGAFDFGKSKNPYDTTFEKIILELDQEDGEDDYEDEDDR